ncbi:hypothetical protein LshimejAT787_0706240 [Lyophyllum shimeji]|uniref:Transmembrane protein n=1 Tax=Lyophyllum shimeji TaxID=47721 RepID=A0A9P3PR87_LYOSH|nr:hypothetical protein LshimejAT787_0706240 [Lyophyllum shimeji]
MIISSSITLGQITFVLRVAIQILSYVGAALILIIALATVSRVAPVDTHDTVNRVVGASTATGSTVKWIFNRLRRKHADPAPSASFLLVLFLSVSYAVFVSISDIGFLGFYACTIPSPNSVDSPASVNSTEAAKNLVLSNMVNGTDPSTVAAYRCDSSTVVDIGDDILLNLCTSWRNSTFADTHLFDSINSTDSDAMMPRRLTPYQAKNASLVLNSFYLGPNTQRVRNPIIHEGLAIEPHDTGVRMVMGVPQLSANKKVDIAKTLAVEVDVGCMALGVRDIRLVTGDALTGSKMLFYTNGTWRKYTGPDYMQDVLSKTVDDVRAYLQPFFNTSSIDSNGVMMSINGSNLALSPAANVGVWDLPPQPGASFLGSTPAKDLMGNCTAALQKKLGITFNAKTIQSGDICGLVGTGGSFGLDGIPSMVYNRMICATATQVNMVDATINVDANSALSMSLTRRPSDLNYVPADFYDIRPNGLDPNSTIVLQFIPYQRYTLNDNPNSPTTHFVHTRKTILSDESVGAGSAGNVISSIGQIILGADFPTQQEYAGLGLLDNGLDQVNFNASVVTRWVGEVGASYFFASLGYNGWAALQSAPIEVVSTGGRVGSCYKPYYALGFVPLLLSAVGVMLWMFIRIFSSSWFGTKKLGEAYGGVTPYTAVACPGAPPKDTLLAWEAVPQPHLQVIQKGYPVVGDAHATALKYLKSAPSYSS